MIITTYKALGDTLLLTAVAKALAAQKEPAYILTSTPELFFNNPDTHVLRLPTGLSNLIRKGLSYKKGRAVIEMLTWHQLKHLHYSVPTKIPKVMESPKEHILTIMARKAMLKGTFDILPRLYLAQNEILPAGKPTIVVQSSIANAGYPLITKEWFPERIQQVVNALKDTFHIVQLGSRLDPPLQGATQYLGSLTLRQAASQLKNARLFIGMTGFLMHLARAVDCPSVIIYGGREKPSQSGYSCNVNITRSPDCSPCWIETSCPHAMKCMTPITSEEVLEGVRRILNCYPFPHFPLPVDQVQLY